MFEILEPLEPLRSYSSIDILDSIYGFITGSQSIPFGDYFRYFYDRYGYILFWTVFIFSAILVCLIIYVIYRTNQLYLKRKSLLKPPKNVGEKEVEAMEKNERWEVILEHIESENPNDWRLAILEADIMLGDMLDKLGYRGESIGEQLKSVDKSDFTTIDDAWEAHKVRNLIAHEGANFTIPDREAKRIIGLYKNVFEEFNFI